eukprot:205396-Rhodomonas_salina.4
MSPIFTPSSFAALAGEKPVTMSFPFLISHSTPAVQAPTEKDALALTAARMRRAHRRLWRACEMERRLCFEGCVKQSVQTDAEAVGRFHGAERGQSAIGERAEHRGEDNRPVQHLRSRQRSHQGPQPSSRTAVLPRALRHNPRKLVPAAQPET